MTFKVTNQKCKFQSLYRNSSATMLFCIHFKVRLHFHLQIQIHYRKGRTRLMHFGHQYLVCSLGRQEVSSTDSSYHLLCRNLCCMNMTDNMLKQPYARLQFLYHLFLFQSFQVRFPNHQWGSGHLSRCNWVDRDRRELLESS